MLFLKNEKYFMMRFSSWKVTFEACFITRAPVKKVILEKISSALLMLEAHRMLHILAKTVSDIADVNGREAWNQNRLDP